MFASLYATVIGHTILCILNKMAKTFCPKSPFWPFFSFGERKVLENPGSVKYTRGLILMIDNNVRLKLSKSFFQMTPQTIAIFGPK